MFELHPESLPIDPHCHQPAPLDRATAVTK